MGNISVIVFHVEQGLCAFIKSPTGRTLLIDCGCTAKFSPIKYIVDNELRDVVDEGAFYFTKFVLSHPHGDHVEDIGTLKKYSPRRIFRQSGYDWNEVKKANSQTGAEHVGLYRAWHDSTYTETATEKIDWGLDLYHGDYLTPDEAEKLQKAKMVNNSSIPVVITYRGTTGAKLADKFLFAGDLEEKGWQELLKRQSFRNAIKGTDFFITSHHGHSSGYCKDIFEAMGKPIINIVSAQSGDESVETAYSSSDNALGIELNGKRRYMLSTRNDGSIRINVSTEGRYSLSCVDYPDNIK